MGDAQVVPQMSSISSEKGSFSAQKQHLSHIMSIFCNSPHLTVDSVQSCDSFNVEIIMSNCSYG